MLPPCSRRKFAGSCDAKQKLKNDPRPRQTGDTLSAPALAALTPARERFAAAQSALQQPTTALEATSEPLARLDTEGPVL